MDMAWPLSSDLLAPLASWFQTEHRRLPWRAEQLDVPHPDPYAVLVSELMLQQTQVAAVIPYFQRWMERFPTAESLASAHPDAVHQQWQGLGYYRRARFLQEAARQLSERGWPSDRAGLAALPGVGAYTSAALASIAFQQPEPALDGNAFRVFARLLALGEARDRHAGALESWLRPALAAHGPSRMTQAVMELGATVCQPAPACGQCPLEARCEARRLGLERSLPAPRPRPEPRQVRLHLVALEAEGHWLVLPPQKRGLLAGLWRWPALEQSPQALCRVAEPWTQVYTHRREEVHPLRGHLPERLDTTEACWISAGELDGLPMGRRDDRMRQLLSSTKQEPALPESEARALLRETLGY